MARLLSEEETHNQWKVLVYGQPGTGKTSLGVSAPDPLFLLSERQGFEHVRKEARRRGVPLPPTLWLETVEDMRRAVTTLHSDEPMLTLYEAFGVKKKPPFDAPQTVVFDSVTELFELFGDEINKQSPPRIGKDGLPAPSERYWGTLIDRTRRFIRAARDLPFHVLFLALEDERGEGDDKRIGPMCPMRKLPSALAAAVNAVGRTEVAQRPINEGKDVELKHRVRFAGPSEYMTKPCPPLRASEEPDFAEWIARLNSSTGQLTEEEESKED